MRIGEAAGRLGVATHVLRHWEDACGITPDRTPAGYRDYTEEHVRRLQVVRSCRSVGLGLEEIRLILHRDEQGRDGVIAARLEAIRRQRAELDAAEAFSSSTSESAGTTSSHGARAVPPMHWRTPLVPRNRRPRCDVRRRSAMDQDVTAATPQLTVGRRVSADRPHATHPLDGLGEDRR